MNKKHLYYGIALFVIALFFMIAAMLFTDLKYPVQAQGTLVFAKSYERGVDIDKIVLTNKQGTITLQLQDNLWRVVENSNYYAGTQLLNLLLTDINTSALFSRQESTPQNEQRLQLQNPTSDNADSGILVQTYAQNKLLDTVVIGKQAANNDYHYAKLANGEIWQVNGQYELPEEGYTWLLQPILEVPSSLVEQIKFYENGQTIEISRAQNDDEFTDSNNRFYTARTLLQQLSMLITLATKDSSTFPPDALELSRHLEIVTFAGLIFNFDFYEDKDQSVWIKLTLSTTTLPMSAVHDYIKDNKFLYDGWFFKLSPQAERKLRPAALL